MDDNNVCLALFFVLSSSCLCYVVLCNMSHRAICLIHRCDNELSEWTLAYSYHALPLRNQAQAIGRFCLSVLFADAARRRTARSVSMKSSSRRLHPSPPPLSSSLHFHRSLPPSPHHGLPRQSRRIPAVRGGQAAQRVERSARCARCARPALARCVAVRAAITQEC